MVSCLLPLIGRSGALITIIHWIWPLLGSGKRPCNLMSRVPKYFWECLRQRAESVAGTLVKKIRMPETSSARAWELIHTKGWTHGKVHLTMTLDVLSNGNYKCIPQPMVVSSSRRAYRKFGADRFVALSVDKSKVRTNEAQMKQFFQQPLAICGRSYRFFFVKIKKGSKDSFTVHAFATDGNGLTGREVTMDMLMEWTLSLNKNCTSVAPKLWSRISLSLSATKPSIIFTLDQIRLVPDIVSQSGQCMTDGCARASPAVFREIWLSGILASKETPTAVQGRIGAAKGVWFVDPLSDPRSEEKWVEIRPSQLKFRYDPITFQDPMLRTLVSLLKCGRGNCRIFVKPQVVALETQLITNSLEFFRIAAFQQMCLKTFSSGTSKRISVSLTTIWIILSHFEIGLLNWGAFTLYVVRVLKTILTLKPVIQGARNLAV